jgi:2-oxoglutarate ferredoxin oxidoreductase subunit beta
MSPVKTEEHHPMEHMLRADRLPHIWCPTCGIGTAVKCFTEAIERSGIDLDHFAIVSGIGCTGRVAGYIKLDSYHTTHGRAIPFATGLKLANPDLKVVVFSGDGDLSAIGGNHLVHAATTPWGAYEPPFNLPLLLESCGACYVARWTALHVRRLTKSMTEALGKRGFSFIEIVTPCSTLYARRNRLGTGHDLMKYYHDNSEIQHGADTRTVGIDFQGKIICGKFVDRERPTWQDLTDAQHYRTMGDKYYRAEFAKAQEEAKSHAQA